MSLVGTLADLSLTELLQLAALTRKSGVLEIGSGAIRAWLGFLDGRIVRVARSDLDLDRKQVLVAAGLAAEDTSDSAEERVHEAALAAVLELFEWLEGRFSFEIGAGPESGWAGPTGLALQIAISPQFLAMEGVRLQDEGDRPGTGEVELSLPYEAARAAAGRANLAPVCAPTTPVIVVDDDIRVAEAVKDALGHGERRVHIFRDSAEGLARFKQYLLRGEVPALVLGAGVVDPMAANRGSGVLAFARRARSLTPNAPVVLLGEPASGEGEVIDGFAPRPQVREASEQDMRDFRDRLRSLIPCDA